MLFDGAPVLICAEVRANSPALPRSTIRACEGCGAKVMTAPSSQAMIDDGAHVCCTDCGLAAAALTGNDFFEPVPGSLEEVANILGPEAAAQTEALIESFNQAQRRRNN